MSATLIDNNSERMSSSWGSQPVAGTGQVGTGLVLLLLGDARCVESSHLTQCPDGALHDGQRKQGAGALA